MGLEVGDDGLVLGTLDGGVEEEAGEEEAGPVPLLAHQRGAQVGLHWLPELAILQLEGDPYVAVVLLLLAQEEAPVALDAHSSGREERRDVGSFWREVG